MRCASADKLPHTPTAIPTQGANLHAGRSHGRHRLRGLRGRLAQPTVTPATGHTFGLMRPAREPQICRPAGRSSRPHRTLPAVEPGKRRPVPGQVFRTISDVPYAVRFCRSGPSFRRPGTLLWIRPKSHRPVPSRDTGAARTARPAARFDCSHACNPDRTPVGV